MMYSPLYGLYYDVTSAMLLFYLTVHCTFIRPKSFGWHTQLQHSPKFTSFFSMADNDANVGGGGPHPVGGAPAAGHVVAGGAPGAGNVAAGPAAVHNVGGGLPPDARHPIISLSLEELQRQRMNQRLSFQVAYT